MTVSTDASGQELRRITIGAIAAWMWFLFAGVTALYHVSQLAILPGMFFAGSALIACPIARDILELEGNIRLGRWVVVVSSIGLWMIGSMLLPFA